MNMTIDMEARYEQMALVEYKKRNSNMKAARVFNSGEQIDYDVLVLFAKIEDLENQVKELKDVLATKIP